MVMAIYPLSRKKLTVDIQIKTRKIWMLKGKKKKLEINFYIVEYENPIL